MNLCNNSQCICELEGIVESLCVVESILGESWVERGQFLIADRSIGEILCVVVRIGQKGESSTIRRSFLHFIQQYSDDFVVSIVSDQSIDCTRVLSVFDRSETHPEYEE
ncbi:hypothetical protein PMAYCL1PPCAC_24141 [Pristionchus mayeri]|uniref:Uncharacterized protein n=1 Tax=Pristionchus mayeri TaxID=1317129 RepID=A0AAN5CZD4_9BILA|nr:hypothetical protein PMAYCL1PPCAC_24141 [Pristionchus mayeri]